MCCRQTSPEATGGMTHITGHAACCFCFGPVRMALVFLSTPSARRATLHAQRGTERQRISIHALREEGDASKGPETAAEVISIHALREEGDRSNTMSSTTYPKFLSTPSARRATRTHRNGRRMQRHFYPRPPRGGRRSSENTMSGVRSFLSTPSTRRATSTGTLGTSAPGNFYPRPPRGGRHSLLL